MKSTRRSFLQTSAMAAAAAPLLKAAESAAQARVHSFDPAFGTALEALTAMRRRAVSAQELVAAVFERIRKYNPDINAFVTLLEGKATEQAQAADELRARRAQLGPLHGLPILVKDSLRTKGIRSTDGAPEEDSIPDTDAVVVERLKQAGAIIAGKTNLPPHAMDWQSNNTIAGRANNPWDLERTPGGSTGGGAAALATGFGFLEIGSDIAGSIRIPSSFCGVYGHKPSYKLVPFRGHLGGAPANLVSELHLTEIGPLARSAEDLLLELSVVAGPIDDPAYSLTIPRARKNRLRDYRLGYVLDDPYCPVDSPVREVCEKAIEELRRAGVQLVEGWPAGLDFKRLHDSYMFMYGAETSFSYTPQQIADFQAQLAAQIAGGNPPNPYLEGILSRYTQWFQRREGAFQLRATFREYFKELDGFLLPTCFIPAFSHDDSDINTRILQTTSLGTAPYHYLNRWVSSASVTGLPSTNFPAGLTADGLPVGMQVVGPYLEDATSLDIASRIARVLGGFTPPPAYA